LCLKIFKRRQLQPVKKEEEALTILADDSAPTEQAQLKLIWSNHISTYWPSCIIRDCGWFDNILNCSGMVEVEGNREPDQNPVNLGEENEQVQIIIDHPLRIRIDIGSLRR
jgi:hypothetical protein